MIFSEYLRGLKFTGDIYSVREGEIVFPMEPIMIVRAPLIEAQLVETALLNIINHQTLIATKASRVTAAAGEGKVVEFGLRRAQGPDAGIYGSRASIIGGAVCYQQRAGRKNVRYSAQGGRIRTAGCSVILRSLTRSTHSRIFIPIRACCLSIHMIRCARVFQMP